MDGQQDLYPLFVLGTILNLGIELCLEIYVNSTIMRSCNLVELYYHGKKVIRLVDLSVKVNVVVTLILVLMGGNSLDGKVALLVTGNG